MKKLLASAIAFSTIISTSIVAYADEAGWQSKGIDKYQIDGDTLTTHIKSLDGGGVKVCVTDADYKYTVQLYEADKTSPDDKVGGVKTLEAASNKKQCLTWSGVNADDGVEELYLKFSKNNTKVDNITIEWFD